MELLGMSVFVVGFFLGFGLLVGILFGFFGMGGSILVTPALLVLDYPATVAIGSGLAFVFGTAVNSALRHRALGQVEYKLAGLMGVGMTTGIGVGKRTVLQLEQLGSADLVIGWVYVGLLGMVGLFILRDVRTGDTHAGRGRRATGVQALETPPMVSLTCGTTISVWGVLGAGLGVGFLAGFLGVGGGFLLLPVMVYGFGVPAAVAVGTDILQIMLSSAFGTFIYAQSNAVDIPVVAAMLGGSAPGARIGAGATRLVDEADIKGYFAVTLLAGSGAVASKQLSDAYAIAPLDMLSVVLIFGAVCLVSSAIVHASIDTLREDRKRGPPTTR